VLAFLKARLKPEKRRIAASRYKKTLAEIPPSVTAGEQPATTSDTPAGDGNKLDPTDS
jgi:hypothetical protein